MTTVVLLKGVKIESLQSMIRTDLLLIQRTFLDDHKEPTTITVQTNHIITMIDKLTSQSLATSFQGIHCFWCRHPFNTMPIGYPVKYHYPTKEKIVPSFFDDIQSTVRKDELMEKGYYETDGIFCSFNCCYAWANDNNLSTRLICKLYEHIYHKQMDKIVPAPSWRLLKAYGGKYDIEEYRNTFNKILVQEIRKVNIPYYKSIGHVYSTEHILF